MPNREYIAYLNTLHNAQAGNENAYTENNQGNPYYERTMVSRPIVDYLAAALDTRPDSKEGPVLLILTGHAGDGKTGILLQVLNKWRALSGKRLQTEGDVLMPAGGSCHYVKDFSELSDAQRISLLKSVKERISAGQSVFLVANTGPLTSAFASSFSQSAEQVLLRLMSDNCAEKVTVEGLPLLVFNVATMDNTDFASGFLRKIMQAGLWQRCSQCKHRESCCIYENYLAISESLETVSEFITNHYLWQQEHGHRLTLRQMTAHLSLMVTGGRSCSEIYAASPQDNALDKLKYLFSNLFFGYRGTSLFPEAQGLQAIRDIVKIDYGRKRLRIDNKLFLPSWSLQTDSEGYAQSSSFSPRGGMQESEMLQGYQCYLPLRLAKACCRLAGALGHTLDWQKAVRRAYLLAKREPTSHDNTDIKNSYDVNASNNVNTINSIYSQGSNDKIHRVNKGNIAINDNQRQLLEDVFSPWFPRYLAIRRGGKVNGLDKNIVFKALSLLYVGADSKQEQLLYVTLRRASGVTQNVQLVYGKILEDSISIRVKRNGLLRSGKSSVLLHAGYQLNLYIGERQLKTCLTLPLMDYFFQLGLGIIDTDIDPQLSRGLDSLKAQIGDCCPPLSDLHLLSFENGKQINTKAALEDTVWILS